jgi:hypothetical protein
VQTFVVPDDVTSVTILATGGSGGISRNTEAGGLGAKVQGTFTVTPGTTLNIVVAGAGAGESSTVAGGGGGGSFVYTTSDLSGLLIAAGGGGGAGLTLTGGSGLAPSASGQAGAANGGGGSSLEPGVGGTNGNGGTGGSEDYGDGGGGGGLLADGLAGLSYLTDGYSAGGTSLASGAAGGVPYGEVGYYGGAGGFGGGGGGGRNGGGGGGGYNGGGGGGVSGVHAGGGGGGGGSFCAVTPDVAVSGENSGAGQVVITYAASSPVISSGSTATGTYGTTYTDSAPLYTIVASNSPASYGGSNLPAGLSVDASGNIVGTPTASGTTSNVSVSATNAGGTASATLTITINAVVLTVTGVTASDKTYDGTATASVNTDNAELSGVLASDVGNVSLSGTPAGAFVSSGAATGVSVNVTGLTLSGGAAPNYTLTQPSPTANIDALGLAVTGVTASDKTYDGSSQASLTTTGAALSGVLNADVINVTLSGTPTGTFASASVASNVTVTVAGFTLSGSAASNYSIIPPAPTANITARTITVTGTTANSKTYDGTALATLNTGGSALSGVLIGDVSNVALGGTPVGAFASSGVGTGITVATAGFTISGSAAPNYTLTQPTTSANIMALALTVSGVTAGNKAYDGGTSATLDTTSAALVGVLRADLANVTLAGTANGTFASSGVGYGIRVTVAGLTLSGNASNNYTLTQPAASANITAKSLTVTGVTANSRVYDGTAVASLNSGNAALSGVLVGDVANVSLGGSPVGTFASSSVATGVAVTTSGFSISGSAAPNYTLTPPTAAADITAKTVTITGVTANAKVYDGTTGASLNTGNAALAGVLAGDVANVSLGGSPVGTFASSGAATGITVTIAGFTISGSGAPNYTLTQPSAAANITAEALTITGVTANAKVYDGTTVVSLNTGSAVLSGVLLGDIVNVTIGGSPVGTFASCSVATGVAVTTSGFSISGSAAPNYTLTQPTATADITAKALTVTGLTASNKAYDGTSTASLNAGSAGLSGVVSRDLGNVFLSGTPAGTFASTGVGTAITVTVTGLSLGGTSAANYSLTPPTLSANISAATATVSLSSLTATYNGSAQAVTATTTPSGLPVVISYNGHTTAPTEAGTYPVSAVVQSSNYSGSASGTLTISPAAQTITFPPASGATIGTPLSLTATASSGLPITYSIASGHANLGASALTLEDGNPVVVQASQPGNNDYLAAANVTQSFNASKLTQSISYIPPSNQTTASAPFQMQATASSGLPVTFTLLDGPATLGVTSSGVGNASLVAVNLTGTAGTVSIQASQSGNATYQAAPNVTITFMVSSAGAVYYFGTVTQGASDHGTGLKANDVSPAISAAAVVSAAGNTGMIVAYLPNGASAGFAVNFTTDSTGAFSATTTALTMGSASPTSLTVQGQVSGTAITGTIEPGGYTFSIGADAAAGPSANVAGLYTGSKLNSSSGTEYAIVGTQGEIFVLAATPTSVSGGTGTVAANGSFSVPAAGSASIAGSVDGSTGQISDSVTQAGGGTVQFSGVASGVTATSPLLNLSARGFVGSGQNALVAGFVIGGTGSTPVLLRAVGPTLGNYGVTNVLSDPVLQLFNGQGTLIDSNQGWGGETALAALFSQVGAFGLPSDSTDSALAVTLAPGTYTIQVTGANGTAGAALAEIYDASANPDAETTPLVNISTRGSVTGTSMPLIAGFVIAGNNPKQVLVRGVGPGLAAFGISSPLSTPSLTLFDGNSNPIAQNQQWETPLNIGAGQNQAGAASISAAAAQVGAFALASGSADTALLITLAPGNYTAEVSGSNGDSGVALLEVYQVSL